MEHIPVLLSESINGLDIKPDGIYLDGTLGRAGHAREIVKRLGTGRLIAIDCDEDAIHEAKSELAGYEDKITFVHGDFGDIANIISEAGFQKVDGMLFDLGVSSPQLDDAKRGFSYMQNAPLDMRMDKRSSLSAFEAVNNWQEEELKKVFFEYGEERYSKSIAREIVRKRTSAPIKTTFELNEIIIGAIPAAARRQSAHPSKRCFQALRIAVNDELGKIEKMLTAAPELLKQNGRLCVISFHSLEDRRVKKSFAAGAKGCICPADAPICICGVTPKLKVITRKPVTAGIEETKRNPRAKSAKLRIASRL